MNFKRVLATACLALTVGLGVGAGLKSNIIRDAQAATSSVTLAGSFNSWNTTAEPLTKNGNYWTIEKTLAADATFKFVVNGSDWIGWGDGMTYPTGKFAAESGNGSNIKCLTAGTYLLKAADGIGSSAGIVIEDVKINVTLQATFSSDVPTYVNIYAPGSFNSWANDASSKMTRVNARTFSLALNNIPASSSEYKLVAAYSDQTSFTWGKYEIDTGANKSVALQKSDGGNTVSLGSARGYDFATNMPDPTVTSWKMVGNGSRWTGNFVYENGLDVTVNPDNFSEIEIIDVNLTAGDTFKFFDGTTWYGFSNIKTDSPLYSAFQSSGSNNILVKEGYSGKYSFFVNVASGSATARIWATSSDYVALDGWARGFVDADDLCDGEGEEWSTYAGYYAALDDSAKALFTSEKVTSKSNGSYIEKAAYRYDNGVAKGLEAFAAAQRPTSSSLRTTPIIGNSDSIVTIIVIVSVASVTSLGLFLFLKKRKEN